MTIPVAAVWSSMNDELTQFVVPRHVLFANWHLSFFTGLGRVLPVLTPLCLKQWWSLCWSLWGGGGCLTLAIGFLGIARPDFSTATIEKVRSRLTFAMLIRGVFLLGLLTFSTWLNLRCHLCSLARLSRIDLSLGSIIADVVRQNAFCFVQQCIQAVNPVHQRTNTNIVMQTIVSVSIVKCL